MHVYNEIIILSLVLDIFHCSTCQAVQVIKINCLSFGCNQIFLSLNKYSNTPAQKHNWHKSRPFAHTKASQHQPSQQCL